MGLPNLSYMMKVGQIRHIQARYERPGSRNPDDMVRHFLTLGERLGCAVRGRFLLERLRANPFYYYVLARTRHYDELFDRAAGGAAGFILNIGCGGDTRAYRWRRQLVANGVAMVECDQRAAIEEKERVARRGLGADHVQYLPVDLNDGRWPTLDRWLDTAPARPGFVMLEGVSPYIDQDAFAAFLALLARRLAPGSEIAYDYKIAGVADAFGWAAGGAKPFRLGADAAASAAFHAGLGLEQFHHELGTALVERRIGRELLADRVLFGEDALLRCRVGGSTA